MKIKQPFLEIIEPPKGSSLKCYHRTGSGKCLVKSWHFHPEIELVCIPKGEGRLFIGNRTYSYEKGVIILLHSNIPHTSFDHGFEEEHYEEYVVQVVPAQLNVFLENFSEFEKVKQLIKASKEGVVLPLGENNRFFVEKYQTLLQSLPLKKWLLFMEILDELSQSNYEILNVLTGKNPNTRQSEQIEKVFDYIAANFMHPVSSKSAAELLCLTDTSFCRFFQKHTQKTFKQVLNEYRITHACRLLSFSEKSIEHIAYETGYGSQSFFNRMFKEAMYTTPMIYRRERQELLLK